MEEHIVAEIMSLFEDMYNMRLIEKLSRPSDVDKKRDLQEQYAKKFQRLHEDLETIKSQSMKDPDAVSTKAKSTPSTKGMKNSGEWRK